MGMVKDQGARLRRGEGSWLEEELHEELGVARERAQSPATESMPCSSKQRKTVKSFVEQNRLEPEGPERTPNPALHSIGGNLRPSRRMERAESQP